MGRSPSPHQPLFLFIILLCPSCTSVLIFGARASGRLKESSALWGKFPLSNICVVASRAGIDRLADESGGEVQVCATGSEVKYMS